MPKPQHYPTPLKIPPKSGTTPRTILIILHGRGSTADIFAKPLLDHLVSPRITAQGEEEAARQFYDHFPTAQFVFPTASLRRAVAYNRSLTHQWFDQYPLDEYAPEHKSHIQLVGLKESVTYIHGLISEAVREVGARNIVLMGLSQGCATALLSALLWEGEALGAIVGFCGWLPLREGVNGAMSAGEDEEDGDGLFDRGEKNEGEEDKSGFERGVEWLREELELKINEKDVNIGSSSIRKTPFFLGHGVEDEKVPFQLGRLAARCLQEMDLDVTFHEYKGLGHWYSEDMLKDIVSFIQW
ncbi:phospholipase/carboxylesterase family protein-like protein [Aaosphaeria arxii CBS 175.79]|uniref:Phospholipase/carboxylesterase family protein-like protein n=1 Tax=Aaosphaeria arxii CBS 175.79 TaxID=1450172 RepID=A0A6A5Y9N9_9PLEO|nr:phospholipase/carboxylesterase family protein-like protein [Aaosphaeria arxii CBS 175.79]KAF2021471.1 phospholipase/carboxylesterase family protein-like protein [Aaosphaeria arxii CBS 175.79]